MNKQVFDTKQSKFEPAGQTLTNSNEISGKLSTWLYFAIMGDFHLKFNIASDDISRNSKINFFFRFLRKNFGI